MWFYIFPLRPLVTLACSWLEAYAGNCNQVPCIISLQAVTISQRSQWVNITNMVNGKSA